MHTFIDNNNLLYMKRCIVCKIEKNIEEFHKCKRYKDGRRSKCAECYNVIRRDKTSEQINHYNEYQRKYAKINREKHNEYQRRGYAKHKEDRRKKQNERYKKYRELNNARSAKRRAKKYSATIGNFDIKLKEIYKNCPIGFHVDHIVPLQGKNVSGLHVPWNLQYLPAIDNLKKGNRFGD